MAKAETDKLRYLSKYGGDEEVWVSAAQIIAELMCERMARKDGKSLKIKFWNDKEWKQIFLTQLRFANALFKIYDKVAISRALRSKEGSKIYSLNAKWLDDLISKEQLKLDSENKAFEESKQKETTEITNKSLRPTFVQKKTIFEKLNG